MPIIERQNLTTFILAGIGLTLILYFTLGVGISILFSPYTAIILTVLAVVYTFTLRKFVAIFSDIPDIIVYGLVLFSWLMVLVYRFTTNALDYIMSNTPLMVGIIFVIVAIIITVINKYLPGRQ